MTSLNGSVQRSITCALPASAVRPVGAGGSQATVAVTVLAGPVLTPSLAAFASTSITTSASPAGVMGRS